MTERQEFMDGSVAERPGPMCLWRVKRGADPYPHRFPPGVLQAVAPGALPECKAAAFCRVQNRFYHQFIEEAAHAPLHPTL